MFPSPQRPVLLATDFSEAADAVLPSAIQLCGMFGAELNLLHVAPADADLSDPDVLSPLAELLREREKTAREAGLDVCTIVTQGDPLTRILQHARGAGTVAIGRQGVGRPGRLHPGGLTRSLLQRAQWPLLVASAGQQRGRIKVVLHPTRLGPRAEDQIRSADVIACRAGARLVLLHVPRPPDDVNLVDGRAILRIPSEGAHELRPTRTVDLHTVAEHCLARPAIMRLEIAASPAAGIAHAAREAAADLIVVHCCPGATTSVRRILGNTAESILAGNGPPVLVLAEAPPPRSGVPTGGDDLLEGRLRDESPQSPGPQWDRWPQSDRREPHT